ncbi:MAG TPA: TM2 domain-containing protein [Alphaproteobacteria bacterium]
MSTVNVSTLDPKIGPRYEASKKSETTAYLLMIFFGLLGTHRFYLGRYFTAVTILVASIVSLIVTIFTFGFGIFVFVLPGIWLVVDLFRIPSMVRKANSSLTARLMAESART